MELVAVHGVGGEEGLRFARLRGSAGVLGGRSTEQEKTFHFLPFTFYLSLFTFHFLPFTFYLSLFTFHFLPFPLTFSEAIRPGINEHK
jgi:hypothetical protein